MLKDGWQFPAISGQLLPSLAQYYLVAFSYGTSLCTIHFFRVPVVAPR